MLKLEPREHHGPYWINKKGKKSEHQKFKEVKKRSEYRKRMADQGYVFVSGYFYKDELKKFIKKGT